MYGSRINPADIREEDLVRADAQADRTLAWIEEAQADLDKVVGVGEGASGQVRVEVTADGRVLGVVFEPRAMRLDSRTLAEEVLSAVARARGDAAGQVDRLMREGLPGFDPAEAAAQFERLLDTSWRR
ncbi:YbaB/EbfC family nucleoid-associated protein [Streptosporangium sp. NPDC051022]|uniref:YbaB/EbfC family nucleoid-associated protein n=1 Tax=Streptosporangium sp. NPDC051022 TaxID=3155752 RepID=UPI003429C40D